MSFMFGGSSSQSASSTPATQPRRHRAGRRTTVQDGKITAKTYNAVAGRPYPPIGKLTSEIVVQMGYPISALVSSTTVPVYTSLAPTLGAMSGASPFLALFDQYKIEQIEFWMEPANPSLSATYGEIASCVDLDDANTPTTLGQVADHPGAIVASGTCGRYHKWVPHLAVGAYSGTFSSFANVPATWIDSASTGVQHYGLKICIMPTSVVVTYNLYIRARVAWRAPGIA